MEKQNMGNRNYDVDYDTSKRDGVFNVYKDKVKVEVREGAVIFKIRGGPDLAVNTLYPVDAGHLIGAWWNSFHGEEEDETVKMLLAIVYTVTPMDVLLHWEVCEYEDDYEVDAT